VNQTPGMESRASGLRRAFDLSFALPPSTASPEVQDHLLIRVAGDRFAISLREIARIVAEPKVVPVPSAARDLLGLVGVRGGIVPVFGLASILGYSQGSDSPRWMILCRAEEPIGLAFSELEGHVRLPKSGVYSDENLRATHQYLAQVARTDSGVRAVISISLIVATIRNRSDRQRLGKE